MRGCAPGDVRKPASTARCLMECRRKLWGWLFGVFAAAVTNTALAQTMPAMPSGAATPGGTGVSPVRPGGANISSGVQQGFLSAPVPLDQLAPPIRERVRSVLEHP